MSRQKSADPFRSARRRFERWRKERVGRAQIPGGLWRAAATLARKHGISKTALALGLNHTALKQHMGSTSPPVSAKRVHHGEFVEMPFALPMVSECSVDIEDGAGSKLSIQLKGASTSQVEAVVRSIWSSRA